MHITLKLSESALTISPAPPQILDALTFVEKKMDGSRSKVEVYRKVGPNHEGIMTQQGFWHMIRDLCHSLGWQCTLEDHRKDFPAPRLDLTGGMRFSQPKLVMDALAKGCSGLVSAPTRYGKSFAMMNIVRAFPTLNTVITAPGSDLVLQLADDAKKLLPDRKIKVIGAGRSSSRIADGDLIVASMDSLHKIDKTATDLLLVDEVHASVTNTRIPMFNAFTRARRIGFGATPGTAGSAGRFDNRNMLVTGLFGPMLSAVSYREAVAEGAICPIDVVMIQHTFDPWNCNFMPVALKRLVQQNGKVANITKLLCDNLLPGDWQTLLFIKNEDQAEFMARTLSNGRWPVAMAKLLTGKARKELTADVKAAVYPRVLCSDIYVQGMTFPDIRCLINLSGGGPYTSAIQKPGRLAEIRPSLNKKRGLMIDFMPVPSYQPDSRDMPDQAWRGPVINAKQRLECYENIGYGVHVVNNPASLSTVIHKLVND